MDLYLRNRVALVAAASQGLGYATALELSREGVMLAICSRNEASINAAADAIHSETREPVLGVPADITSTADIQRLIDRVVEEYGGLDILVTNVGGPPSGGIDTVDDAAWQAAFDSLLMGTVRLIRTALPHLRQSAVPVVLANTSWTIKEPVPNLLLSNSVRMAVTGLIKSLSRDLGHEGIRFNCIVPGWIETERVTDIMEDRALRHDTSVQVQLKLASEEIALRRMGTPQEFANVAAFLCSPRAAYITGAAVPVDGGVLRGSL